MRKIKISDITLREEANSSCFSLNFKEKIELAKELDKSGADIIETAPLADEKVDSLFIRTIAPLLKTSVLSCPAGLTEESTLAAWNAVKGAANPRLLVSVPVSVVQMEYLCGQKPAQIMQLISKLVKKAADLCDDVEFSAEDAGRADREFLCAAIETAVNAGAKTVTICDSAGNMLPDEFAAFLSDISAAVPSLAETVLSVQCSNELGLALASCASAVGAGAGQIKTTVSSAALPHTEAVANLFSVKGSKMGVCCRLDMMALRASLRRMSWLVNNAAPAEPADVAAGKSEMPEEISLDKSADIYAVGSAVTRLGYTLSDEDLTKVFEAFGRIAAKKSVNSRELETIVASAALQVPATYKIISYIINSGNVISPTANILMEKDGQPVRGLSSGDGPVDSAFLAIEQICGRRFELDDFRIRSVTEGREAMGNALVRLRSGGKLFAGQGISTDIIGAAIRAYTDALNKIIYEENLK
ncbi:MAG: hypothetical protein FWG32_08635 [Oscillospiraceae bacterium]|nr:hypothetical protein [Oscillospiraceae bacterium]